MTPVRGGLRLRGLAVFSLLWGTASGVQANEGIRALLQFAEQYRSQSPAGSPAPPAKAGVQEKKKSATQPISSTGAGDSPTLRRALKQRDGQLVRQQAMLRAQETQLAGLRQALKSLEEKAAAKTPQPGALAHPATSADFAPLQQLVARLSDAAGGSPDAKRSAELIAHARREADDRCQALADSQAQVRTLKIQLGDLKKLLQSGGQSVERELHARQVLQSKLDGAQAQRDEMTVQLKAAQAQLTAAGVQRQALEAQQADTQRALAVLKTQHETLTAERETQKMTFARKEAELTALQAEKQAARKQHDALQQQLSTADTRLVTQDQEIMRLKDDINLLRDRAKWLVKPEVLKDPTGRQAYAAGSALGRDIIEMLNERKGWGVEADRPTVLAGVIDAFSGQYQLTTDVLSKALAESEAKVNQAREKASQVQRKKGEAFVAGFRKQKEVKQSSSGFWYRVDYAGDTPIADDAIVEVVVKESLTDGTVIQDMDLSGNVLSQPLAAYPLLFREAIGHLRNHGTLTMVVPPALAYGEEGYPPRVPPNATMVYELRIDGVKSASGVPMAEGKSGLAE